MDTESEKMRVEVASGLFYAHSRDNSNTAKLLGGLVVRLCRD
jgi:hypothetical protein